MKQFQLFVALIAVLGAGSVGWGAQNGSARRPDPFVGTWKLNIARSKIDPATLRAYPVPDNQTEVYRAVAGERMEMVWTRPGDTGAISTSTFRWPLQGGKVEDEFTTPAFFSVTTVIGPGDFYVTYIQDGKQANFMHKVVSPDGKTMTITQSGVVEGRPATRVLIWER